MSADDQDRWNDRYRRDPQIDIAPSPLLLSLDGVLPKSGRALDVAGGTGRHALWLAGRGLDVTLCDISDEALDVAARRAVAAGVRLDCLRVDLETDVFPAGPWELILVTNFLLRPLFHQFSRTLSPGGALVVIHPTMSNLTRHESPSARYLLDDGELPSLADGLEVVAYEEGWLDGRHHTARLVARRHRRG